MTDYKLLNDEDFKKIDPVKLFANGDTINGVRIQNIQTIIDVDGIIVKVWLYGSNTPIIFNSKL